jgi:hypothetical protein
MYGIYRYFFISGASQQQLPFGLFLAECNDRSLDFRRFTRVYNNNTSAHFDVDFVVEAAHENAGKRLPMVVRNG